MVSISSLVAFVSGTPQFRIKEDFSGDAPLYFFYGQTEIEEGLAGLDLRTVNKRQVRTFECVSTAVAGDVIFSLISGKAAIVQTGHSGYLFTQNYVKLVPSAVLDAQYLVYMINEDGDVRRQLRSGQQGSVILKYTIRQLSSLLLPPLPPKDVQEVVGELYLSQLRLAALKRQASVLETALVLGRIKEANKL